MRTYIHTSNINSETNQIKARKKSFKTTSKVQNFT